MQRVKWSRAPSTSNSGIFCVDASRFCQYVAECCSTASTCKSFLLETATYLYTLTQEVRSQQHTFPNFPCSFLISKQIPSRVSLSSFLYCITSSLSFLFIIYMSRGGKLTTKDLQTPRCRTDIPHDIFYSSNNKTRYLPSCTYLRF